MKLILIEDVDKVGYKYDVVTVKNGYGRNFLIPQKKGLIANETNMKRLTDLQNREERALEKRIGEFQEIATKLDGKILKIAAKAGTSGKIFGSVTSIQISNALKDQFQVEVERRRIEIKGDVKSLGEYICVLKMHPKVSPELKFEVVAD